MKIGIPLEIKVRETRVSLTPAACEDLVKAGHQVFIQSQAGVESGYADSDYQAGGCVVCETAESLYRQAELVVKVKEPVADDLALLRQDHVLFCYLHLAANPALIESLQKIGLTAIAFETVEDEQKRLPLLAPMSAIAGRLSTQIGANLLHKASAGKGVLLGGIAGTCRGRVVILGAGNAGRHAAEYAAQIGAEVSVFDLDLFRLQELNQRFHNVTTLIASPGAIAEAVRNCDLLIGAVLVTGARAPVLVSEELVRKMQAGSVIVDIAVDQGGCVETIRPTTYDDPVYLKHDVIHFAVSNMPGAVPQTATQALSGSILPYVLRLAGEGVSADAALQRAINVQQGKVIHPALLK